MSFDLILSSGETKTKSIHGTHGNVAEASWQQTVWEKAILQRHWEAFGNYSIEKKVPQGYIFY